MISSTQSALLAASFSWRQVYWVLAVPGIALGLVFAWQAAKDRPAAASAAAPQPTEGERDQVELTSFLVLTLLASLQGFVYTALMSFLPRYLSGVRLELPGASRESFSDFLAAGVLLLGCVGQFLAGRQREMKMAFGGCYHLAKHPFGTSPRSATLFSREAAGPILKRE